MAEYIDKNKIPWAKVDNPKGVFWERVVFESAINNITPADVIEREKIDNALADMQLMLDQEVLNDNVISDVGQGIAIAMELLRTNIGE